MKKVEIICPKCGETKVIKHGISKVGFQRYCCCNEKCKMTTFQMDYVYNGCKPDAEQRIKAMAQRSNGIRATSRILKVSAYKVINTLKEP